MEVLKRYLDNNTKGLLMVLGIIVISITSFSQKYSFKKYGIDEGLSQYVYSVTQGNDGYLWIGTSNGLYKFNGLNFEVFQSVDSLANNFITKCYKDKSGLIWFGHKNGGISCYDGKKFKKIYVSRTMSSPINDIFEDKLGNIWFVTQTNGLVKIKDRTDVKLFWKAFMNINLYSIQLTDNNDILLGTESGLLICNYNPATEQVQISRKEENIPKTKINCINHSTKPGIFWIGTQDKGVLMYNIVDRKATEFNPFLKINDLNVHAILEDEQSNLWITTFGNGLYKLIATSSGKYYDLINYNEKNGLISDNIESIYQDKEGNIWLGTYGKGLTNLIDDIFTFYYQDGIKNDNNVNAICFDNTTKWFGINTGIVEAQIDNKGKWNYKYIYQNKINQKVTSIDKDNLGHLWVGTEHDGLFSINLNNKVVEQIKISEDQLSRSINYLKYYHNTLWVATKNGLFAINPITGKKIQYSTQNGLPHNNINHICPDSKGNIWVATLSDEVCMIDDVNIVKIKIPNQNEILNVSSIVEDKFSNKWFATLGKGVFKYDGKTFTNYNTQNGLKSDFCYSITCDEGNNIWIGHRQGISRIKVATNHINFYEKKDGIKGDCAPNAIFKYNNGDVWFGTSDGLLKYDHLNDQKENQPPIVHLMAIKVLDHDVPFDKELSLTNKKYTIRFDFIGINLRSPGGVKYRYKLEGYDVGWSDFSSSNSVTINRLEEGDYDLYVQAINDSEVMCKPTKLIHIHIDAPLWKRVWFIILAILAFFALIYFVIKLREVNHIRMKKLLQERLDERTHKVIAQKEELEVKNNDIMASLNYAKRIQQAILPDERSLKEFFPESFIFYMPRDIVSGDFYWFKKVGNKLIVACVDCTGHGVPGALMSMIGSILLKDISELALELSPKDILIALDKGVSELLRQEAHATSNDGMDLSICEFDLEKNSLRFAGACSKLIVYTKDGINLYNGSKSSVGGSYISEKDFVNIDIPLHSGDIVYLFSDGIIDQFGGVKSKKLKLSGFQEILNSIVHLNMKAQLLRLINSFEVWKHSNPQTDDILIIGIKIS